MPKQPQRPEWVPPEGGSAFTTSVIQGVDGGHDGMSSSSSPIHRPAHPPRRRHLSVDDYVRGVLDRDRTILARTITLVESNAPAHMETAQEVLKHLLPHAGNAIRIGITGVPGVGKSTFIEAFGHYLCQADHHVAVLAVDPSSSITRGSILGDKTRMEKLTREPNAFIRPTPSGGTLGGVARKSRETMLVCEAAGFDVILLETVGVGQNEITVRSMVDFFLFLALPGAGDELQGIKKGITEIADAIIINKADGDNKIRAQLARSEYNRALHYMAPATEGWSTRATTCSALTGEGIADIWTVIQQYRTQTTESGVFQQRRRTQTRDWVHTMVEEHLRQRFFSHQGVATLLPELERAVMDGDMPVTTAVRRLLAAFEEAREPR